MSIIIEKFKMKIMKGLIGFLLVSVIFRCGDPGKSTIDHSLRKTMNRLEIPNHNQAKLFKDYDLLAMKGYEKIESDTLEFPFFMEIATGDSMVGLTHYWNANAEQVSRQIPIHRDFRYDYVGKDKCCRKNSYTRYRERQIVRFSFTSRAPSCEILGTKNGVLFNDIRLVIATSDTLYVVPQDCYLTDSLIIEKIKTNENILDFLNNFIGEDDVDIGEMECETIALEYYQNSLGGETEYLMIMEKNLKTGEVSQARQKNVTSYNPGRNRQYKHWTGFGFY